ncbi:peroxisomal membrane protein PEX16 [Frankliniella occidentalis]|uniref:Peroxisomal membrane protein PEX16 n=1 Tax=Frankliniella occidentalis TaxID=133901 RepID=A0A6J1T9C9_FRAOC|nr:peroxisomal membrane protein PEX16 [Frankliniella occidentalis]
MSTSLKELYLSYKKWVGDNPLMASDFEMSAKWISYIFAGRIQNSSVITELVYSMSNLLVLFNDCIINESRRTLPLTSGSTLKTWLTVLEYAEVFLEITAKSVWGEKGRWILIGLVQAFKCIGRLILLFTHKEHIVQMPPIPPLKRRLLSKQDSQDSPATIGFSLKSGRIIRCVNSASPTHLRSWKPPAFTTTLPDGSIPDRPLDQNLLLAETLYIVKPVLHLCSMLRFGPKAWRPYILSLFMDVASLHMFRRAKKQNGPSTLSPRQKMELSRREVALLLYILRSPFYEKYSQKRINRMLEGFSNNLPLVGYILRPLAQYIPHWQETYFYMWSS